MNACLAKRRPAGGAEGPCYETSDGGVTLMIETSPFAISPDEWAWVNFTRRLRSLLATLDGGRVCELGAGARPALELGWLHDHNLDCLLVDSSEAELEKAPAGYDTLRADVTAPAFSTGDRDGTYDAVFSRTLAEHVRDPVSFHRNVRRLLRPGGIAMHFFPTLWWPPFIVNRVLPEPITERILLLVEPWRRRSGPAGKFPAYYRWCRGPTGRQVRRFESIGFTVEHCVAYFGESSHAPGRLLGRLNEAWTRTMLRHPNYHFTSYAAYTLRARG